LPIESTFHQGGKGSDKKGMAQPQRKTPRAFGKGRTRRERGDEVTYATDKRKEKRP